MGALTDQKLSAAYEGKLHLLNTRLVNNTFASCGRSDQTPHSLGGNLDSGSSCEFYPALGGLVLTHPRLGALHKNGGMTLNMALLDCSPGIDSGNDIGCPVTDQRGVSRLQGNQCDRGANEYQACGQGDHK